MSNALHLLIAGSNKCGTTSLFRYLCDHPTVCGSAIKEAHFFSRHTSYDAPAAYKSYCELFPRQTATDRVLLEATPSYLDGGTEMATRIKSVLTDPYVILMLRDPTERLISYYRSNQGLTGSPLEGMSFIKFVERALQSRTAEIACAFPNDRNLALQVRKGEYAAPLSQYYSVLSDSRVLVIFFETFSSNPLTSMNAVTRFIGLPSTFYDNYDFSVENRSRYHRSSKLRTAGSRLNHLFEPILNQFPAARRRLRTAYNYVNTSPSKSHDIDAESITLITKYYEPHNRELRRLLEAHMDASELPMWLQWQ